MARRRKGRSVHGILLLDKPSGLSSNHALQHVKRLFGAAKAGHTGSLDPLATGMLPICLGEATKLSAQLLDADKTYQVTMRLGVATDTADADGQVVAQSAWAHVNSARLSEVLPQFLGAGEQIPPMYSALKHQGKRLYEIARSGGEVERPARPIRIHRLELLGMTGADVCLEVNCSKGTYVRTLVEDIAAAVNTHAHVIALRRTALGPFTGPMVSAEELTGLQEREGSEALDSLLLPPAAALADWPRVDLDADACFYFRRGQAMQVRGAPLNGAVAVFGPDDLLLGLAAIDADGRVAPRRLLELRSQGQ